MPLEPGNPRRGTRATARVALLAAGSIEFACRLSARRCGIALVYHRVAARRGDVTRELVPALSHALFAEQLRHVSARYRPVPASQFLDAVQARRRGQRFPVAITFDDDLRSHRDAAMPVLVAQGLPATFFLTGAALREPHGFWWERLQRAVDAGHALDTPELQAVARARGDIHSAARRVERMSPDDRDAVTRALGRLCGPDPRDSGLRAADVRALADARFEIGFHTLRHHPLPTLDDVALTAAMRSGRDELETAAGGLAPVIAYPHGQSDDRVPGAADLAGYRYGFTTSGGAVGCADEPHLLSRWAPPTTSLQAFAGGLARRLLQGCLARRSGLG